MILMLVSCILWKIISGVKYDENEARQFIKKLNEINSKLDHEMTTATWEFETNMCTETEVKMFAISEQCAKAEKKMWKEITEYPWMTYNDSDLRFQFREYSRPGLIALPTSKYKKFEKIISEMESYYASAELYDYHNKEITNLKYEPSIRDIMANSRDEKELAYYWIEWRKETGKYMRKKYPKYVELSNEVATLNNFTDASEMWIYSYTTDNFTTKDFEHSVAQLWNQARPLYQQLHAYVRRKLREKYGPKVVSEKGPIPAHLLGNMWAQSWINIFNFTAPFPNVKQPNITEQLMQKQYTPEKLYRLADSFFQSLNLLPAPDTLWEKSIFQKIPDRNMICDSSAWDFHDGKDYRIRHCCDVNEEDFFVAHHEMGHIQYFMQYKNLSYIYQYPPHPGFQEALGDIIGLTVSTSHYLHEVDILPASNENEEEELNYLFQLALDKVATLPWSYIVDLWRWNVFKGHIKPEYYNTEWWKLRASYQGVQPPKPRSETDFDPGSKHHVNSDASYIEYFLGLVLQFQIHEALCKKSGQYDPQNPNVKPLHRCYIYKKKEAGDILGKMMKLGASKPWPEVLELVTGQQTMDVGPMLRFFAPLYEWLKKENEKTGQFIGWTIDESTSMVKQKKVKVSPQ